MYARLSPNEAVYAPGALGVRKTAAVGLKCDFLSATFWAGIIEQISQIMYK